MDKKQSQLGMNPSTAANRLRMDILYSLVKRCGYKCYRCGEDLTRESFSVEHITPWLDSENPKQMFFDLNNISFSHMTCNRLDARRPNKKYETLDERKNARNEQQNLRRKLNGRIYNPEERRKKYLLSGK